MTEIGLSLIVPCLNEVENVAILAKRYFSVADELPPTEIVYVDDGSNDGTWEKLESLVSEYGERIVVIRHSVNRGIPAAWASGLGVARGTHSCLIDADLQNPPEAVVSLYEALVSTGADLVRGVRVPASAHPWTRALMSKGLNQLLNIVFKMKSADNKSGFILARTSDLRDIVAHTGKYRHFQTFIGVSAHAKGLQDVEVLTPFENRTSGTSFLEGRSVSVIMEALRDIPVAYREYKVTKQK